MQLIPSLTVFLGLLNKNNIEKRIVIVVSFFHLEFENTKAKVLLVPLVSCKLPLNLVLLRSKTIYYYVLCLWPFQLAFCIATSIRIGIMILLTPCISVLLSLQK